MGNAAAPFYVRIQTPGNYYFCGKNGGLNDKVLKAGAVGFLQKPFNGQELVDLINKAN